MSVCPCDEAAKHADASLFLWNRGRAMVRTGILVNPRVRGMRRKMGLCLTAGN